MRLPIVLLTVLALFSCVLPLAAQDHSTLANIEAAYQSGKLDYTTKLLYQLRTVAGKGDVPLEYLSAEPTRMSATMLFLDAYRLLPQLPPEDQIILMDPMARPSGLTQIYDSPGGHFKFHYTTSGGDAATLVYVTGMATWFEATWDTLMTRRTYSAPPSDGGAGGDTKYDVYVQALSAGLLGYTSPEASVPSTPWNDATSYIVMCNSYTPVANGQVTACHEFFHAVQFGYSAGVDNWFYEIASTSFEPECFPAINQYLEYLPEFFSNPWKSLQRYGGADLHEYASCLLGIYFHDKWGPSLMKNIWTNLRTTSVSTALNNALAAATPAMTRDEALKLFEVWNYFTGTRNRTGYYVHGASFGTTLAAIERTHTSYPVSGGSSAHNPEGWGANYIKFTRPAVWNTPMTIAFDGDDSKSWGVTLIKKRTTDVIETESFTLNSYKYGEVTIDSAALANYTEFIMVPILLTYTESAAPFTYSVSLSAGSGPAPPEAPTDLVATSGINNAVPLAWSFAGTGPGGADSLWSDEAPYTDPDLGPDAGGAYITQLLNMSGDPIDVTSLKFLFNWNGGGAPPDAYIIALGLNAGGTAFDQLIYNGTIPVVASPAWTEFTLGSPVSCGPGVMIAYYVQDLDLLPAMGSNNTGASGYTPDMLDTSRTPDPCNDLAFRALYTTPGFRRPETFDHFSVQRSLSNGGPYSEIATPTVNSYTDNAVTNFSTYYYVVSAVYSAPSDESDLSNQAMAVPGTVATGIETLRVHPTVSGERFTRISDSSGTILATFGERLTPTRPCQIIALRYELYPSATGNDFDAGVWRTNGDQIRDPYALFSVAEGAVGPDWWANIDITSVDPIIVWDDFLVSWTPVGDSAYIGVLDETDPRSYLRSSGFWSLNDTISPLIEAIVQWVDTTERFTVSGRVRLGGALGDTSAGDLSGSIVTCIRWGISDTTDADGNYTLRNIPIGTWDFVATHASYDQDTREGITIIDNRTGMDFNLTFIPHPLNVPGNLQAQSYKNRNVPLSWEVPMGGAGTSEVFEYWDNDSELFYMPGFTTGDIEAVLFAPWFPCTLKTVGMKFYSPDSTYSSYEFHVWKDDGYGLPDLTQDLVTTPITFTAASYNLTTIVDLTPQHIVVGATQRIFCGVFKRDNLRCSILADDTTHFNAGTSVAYYGTPPNWVAMNSDLIMSLLVNYNGLGRIIPGERSTPPPIVGLPPAPPQMRITAPGYPTDPLRTQRILHYSVYRAPTTGSTVPLMYEFTHLRDVSGTSCVDSTVSNGTNYAYYVTTVYPLGESDPSNIVIARPRSLSGAAEVLVVDDDNSEVRAGFADYAGFYTDQLEAIGVPYRIWQSDSAGENGPDYAAMSPYNQVWWILGINWDATLTDADETELAYFLDMGGRLLLDGQDYLYDRFPPASPRAQALPPTSFARQYLMVDSVLQEMDSLASTTLTAVVTGADSSFAATHMWGVSDIWQNTLYPDKELRISGTPWLRYQNGTKRGAVANFGIRDSFRIAFSTIELSALDSLAGDWSVRTMFDSLFHFLAQPNTVPPDTDTTVVTVITVTMPLSMGWNMIAFPVTPENPAVSAILPSRLSSFYRWNTSARTYDSTTTVVPGRGYFVLLGRDTTIQVRGNRVDTLHFELSRGWSQIGGTTDPFTWSNATVTPDGAIVDASLASWDTEARRYNNGTTVMPGLGYWILSTSSCTVDMVRTGKVAADDGILDPAWTAEFRFESESGTMDFTLGAADGAGDGLDPRLDIPAPPPPIGLPTVELARPDLFFGLRRDVTSTGRDAAWTLSVSEPGRLLVPGLPEGYAFSLALPTGEVALNANDVVLLPAKGTYAITAKLTAESPIRLSIRPEGTEMAIHYRMPVAEGRLSVMDVTGRTIASWSLTTAEGRVACPLTALSTGVTFVRIDCSGGYRVHRIVIAR